MEQHMNNNKLALLHVDMQYIHVHPDYSVSGANQPDEAKHYVRDRLNNTVVPNIRRLLDAFRASGDLIVHVVFNHIAPDGSDLEPGIYRHFCKDPDRSRWAIRTKADPLSAVIVDIAPRPGEIVLEKTTYSAFESTNLDFVLRNHGIRRCIIVGGLTNCCVLRTAASAREKGYATIGVTDAAIAWSETEHAEGLTKAGYSEVLATDDLLNRLI